MINFKSATIGAAFVCAIAGTAQSAVIYDSPAQNFITGITDLVVTGTANDGTFDVTFVDGTFDDAFGVGTMTADLAFQSIADTDTVSNLINAVLNAATPHDLVASAMSATTGSSFSSDLFLVPLVADALYKARINRLFTSTGLWIFGGTVNAQLRDSNALPQFCSTCTTKFAVFSKVPEPGTLVLFGIGLAGLGYMRRKRAA